MNLDTSAPEKKKLCWNGFDTERKKKMKTGTRQKQDPYAAATTTSNNKSSSSFTHTKSINNYNTREHNKTSEVLNKIENAGKEFAGQITKTHKYTEKTRKMSVRI